MGQVTVTVSSRRYQVNCDDGQEAHLVRLSRYLDKRAAELNAAVGHVPEPMLLLMVGLLLADELSDAYGELDGYRSAARGNGDHSSKEATDAELAARIDSVTARIEALVERAE
ncbi:MAG: cell division protein ZapA [Alphaproteobacteria bacterium]|nr:cell division protein ZapA [Alphaproteobacteria bacterium]